ncbi:succinate dehydrogenase/fumarate reductase iron-sulfur subunit [Bacillus sp. 03113]|uniref:succinate dehydrogenase/fumarate reductase iron-sulfur subunit n=1 Tax=Bacillus sp. 03113 TaxID=2578211 RepID=UPI001142133F|nr:succinate dehydrogenase/fumarate reductase iron-sulfur subunit [Bacillus sp. 03113]
MEKITCHIRRFDGEKVWFQEYELPYEKGKTLLWALTKIKEELDPTFNFTSACGHAICGSCGVRVNNHPFLVCKTSLDEILETFHTSLLKFEPLGNFKVIRDLVIDWKPKIEKMHTIKPWLFPNEQGDKTSGFNQSEEEYKRISLSTDCVLCGICASECEQLTVNQDGYLEPFILNRAFRFAVDSRDGEAEKHIEPLLENDLWKCVHCMHCVSHCPKTIPLTEEVAFLRQATMKMGERNNKGARHAYAFHDDVKQNGRLNEMTLPIKTEGLVRTLSRIPFALRLVRKGKINLLQLPKKIEGIEDVRKIYQYVQEMNEE